MNQKGNGRPQGAPAQVQQTGSILPTPADIHGTIELRVETFGDWPHLPSDIAVRIDLGATTLMDIGYEVLEKLVSIAYWASGVEIVGGDPHVVTYVMGYVRDRVRQAHAADGEVGLT